MKAILNYCADHALNFDVSYNEGVFTMIFYSIEDEFREKIPIPSTFLNSDEVSNNIMERKILSELSMAFSFHTVKKKAAKIDDIPEDDEWIDSKHDAEYNRLYFQKKDLRLGDVLPYIDMNDVQINDTMNNDERLVLISKEHNNNVLSGRFLNAEVVYIQNDEDILDTVVIGVRFSEEEE